MVHNQHRVNWGKRCASFMMIWLMVVVTVLSMLGQTIGRLRAGTACELSYKYGNTITIFR